MEENQLLSYNYRNDCNNYILKSNLENRWVAFSKSVLVKLIKKYKNNFNLVIYWNIDKNNIEYYKIPFNRICHLLTDEHLSIEASGEKRRWTFTIIDNLLCVHNNTKYAVDVSSFINTPFTDNCTELQTEIISRAEGESDIKFHKRIERDSKFIRLIKDKYRELHPLMPCQICGFSFVKKYGEIGNGYIEAHHKTPLSNLTGSCHTKESDIAFVCSNCHRMIHASPILSIEDFKKTIKDT